MGVYSQNLYLNMCTLDIRFRMSDILRNMLSKEMFTVVNIKGFVEVVHYLLNIIDPEYVAKNFTWPLINNIDTRKFQSQTRKFIALLIKEKNTDIIIPINPSLMIAPRGPQMCEFLWRLSNYALLCTQEQLGGTKVEYINVKAIDQSVLPARIKTACQIPRNAISVKVRRDEKEHLVFVSNIMKEIRDLEYMAGQSELQICNEKQKIEKIVKSSKVDEMFQFKCYIGKRDEAIADFSKKNEERSKQLENAARVPIELKNVMQHCKTNIQEMNNPQNQLKLNGQMFKAVFPSSVTKYDLNEFFKSCVTTAEIHRKNVGPINVHEMLQSLNSLRLIHKDMSLRVSDYENKLGEMVKIRGRTQVSLQDTIGLMDDIFERNDKLKAVKIATDSPRVQYSESRESGYESFVESRTGVSQEKDQSNIPQWLVNFVTSKKNSACSINQPKSTKPGIESWNRSTSRSENDLNAISQDRDVNSVTNSRRKSLIPTRSETNLQRSVSKRLTTCVEEHTPKREMGFNKKSKIVGNASVKMSPKERITPKRLNDLVNELDSSLDTVATNLFPAVRSDTSSLMPLPSSTPSEPDMEIWNNSLGLADIDQLQDLSIATLPDSSFEGTPTKLTEEKQTNSESHGLVSPSGLLRFQGRSNGSDSNERKRFTNRPSLDRLINRFLTIKNNKLID